MPKPLSLLLFVALMLAGLDSTATRADEPATLKAQVATLQKEVATLRAENEALKRENQTLKRPLGAGVEQKPATLRAPAVQPVQPARATHWITTASSKRHNSGCRYYMNSKGRAGGPGEGVACGICGG